MRAALKRYKNRLSAIVSRAWRHIGNTLAAFSMIAGGLA